jgi:hypothetical protein
MTSRTINVLALVIGFAALTTPSYAAGEAMFDKGASTWTVAAVKCTSGTAIEITTGIAGFDISMYRLTNQHTAVAVWVGPTSVISTDAINGTTLGEQIAAGSRVEYKLGKNPDLAQQAVKIFCQAGDAAGALGARVSRVVFGMK